MIFVFAALIKTESNHIKSNMFNIPGFRSRKSGTIPILHGFIRVPGRSLNFFCCFVSLPVAFAQDGGYRGVRLRAISSEDIENGTRQFHGNIVLPGETMGKPWGNRETNDFLFFKWSSPITPPDMTLLYTIMTYDHTVLQNLLLWHLTLLSCLCCLSAVVLAVTA